MKRTLLLLIALLTLSSPLWLLALALGPAPMDLETRSLSVDDVENARRLLRENDPRRLRDGERKRVELTQRELNLLLRYALPDSAAARVGLAPELLSLAASAPVPANPLGAYLNVEVVFAQSGPTLAPIAVSAGRLRLPAWLAEPLSSLGDSLLRSRLPEYAAALESLESIQVAGDRVALTYRWQTELLEQLKDRGRQLVVPDDQRQRILAYYATLLRISHTLRPGDSLARALGPLFAEAVARSDAGADPAMENRALILALGMAFQRANPNRLVREGDAPVAVVRRLPVTLHGRHDLAQHFAISAALAVGGGSKLADVIGVFKELSDSRGGSGFSFADLLADRAGVVLAERATGTDARQIQQSLANRSDETLFIPSIDRLPEGLQDLEFRSRYEDLDTAAYNRVKS